MIYSVAIQESTNDALLQHLIRADGQEDLCFALYSPSIGYSRHSGIIKELILPEKDDRCVHGNVSFNAQYFDRVTSLALKKQLGICFLHSHPGPGWQGMSQDDINAENFLAPRVQAVTGMPLLGMTTGSDGSWSARFWIKSAPKIYQRVWCQSIRVVGKGFTPHFKPFKASLLKDREAFERTISAWGSQKQMLLSELTVGLVGLGSIGSHVANALIKTGICKIKLFDFDHVELKNIDRLASAGVKNVGQAKVTFYKEHLERISPSTSINVQAFKGSIIEASLYRALLDCDIVFSCVDRPYPRYILNHMAYANIIPIIDGGIDASINKQQNNIHQARWRSITAGPERICLECISQYVPEDVALEMSGLLEDPQYVNGLPEEHFAKKGENVYAFSLAAASNLILQFLSLVLQPMGIYYGVKEMNFATGTIDSDFPFSCKPSCITSKSLAMGDVINRQIIPGLYDTEVSLNPETQAPIQGSTIDRLRTLLNRINIFKRSNGRLFSHH